MSFQPAVSQPTYLAIQQFNGNTNNGQSVILYDIASANDWSAIGMGKRFMQ